MAERTVTVVGLNSVVRSLTRLGVESQDLKAAFNRIGSRAEAKAKAATPTASGRLKESVRQSKRKNSVYLYAGGRRAYYGTFVHYGTRYMAGRPWMRTVARAEAPAALRELENEMSKLIRTNGLS